LQSREGQTKPGRKLQESRRANIPLSEVALSTAAAPRSSAIKRAAMAMREHSNDLYVLANAALVAALPTRDAILQLLEDRAPISPIPVEAAALS